MMLKISSYCTIRNNTVEKDGKIIFFSEDAAVPVEFLTRYYKERINNYPRFFKMDDLSKLAYLSAETNVSGIDLTDIYQSSEISIVICNSSSSIRTDNKYFETIKDTDEYYPSPALFVYTLPNLMLGEISIRFKIKGENFLLISESPDFSALVSCVEEVFNSSDTRCCMAGWVEFGENNCEAFLCTVEINDVADSSNIIFCEESMFNLYHKGLLDGTNN